MVLTGRDITGILINDGTYWDRRGILMNNGTYWKGQKRNIDE